MMVNYFHIGAEIKLITAWQAVLKKSAASLHHRKGVTPVSQEFTKHTTRREKKNVWCSTVPQSDRE